MDRWAQGASPRARSCAAGSATTRQGGPEFRRRYRAELRERPGRTRASCAGSPARAASVYGLRDTRRSSATILRDVVEERSARALLARRWSRTRPTAGLDLAAGIRGARPGGAPSQGAPMFTRQPRVQRVLGGRRSPRARRFYGETLWGCGVTEEYGMLTLHIAGDRDILLVYPKAGPRPGELHDPQLPGRRHRRLRWTSSPPVGITFEQYANHDAQGRHAKNRTKWGPPIAWFKDPAGNILSVLQADASRGVAPDGAGGRTRSTCSCRSIRCGSRTCARRSRRP